MKDIEDSGGAEAKPGAQAVLGQNPPWKAKTVWLAALLALIGLVFWAKDAGRSPARPSSTSAPGAAGFAEGAPGAGEGQGPQAFAKTHSSALFRLGVSYVGGFFLGWAFRRFLKAALLVSGALLLLVALGKKLGWLDLDWTSLQEHVRQSLAWLQGEAGSLKQFFTGYLPSATAAAVGAFLGFRRK